MFCVKVANATTLCFAVILLAVISAPMSLRAGTWTPDPSLGNADQHRRMYEIGRAFCDTNFDPAANLLHQKRDHLVRESTYYAYALLLTGDPADRDRAQAILRRVLTEQDTRPNSKWRGAFLWTAEQKWETVINPDMNSAAFVGSALAMIVDLDRRHPVLDSDLRQKLDEAGKLAVGEILRRDVDTGYTNIVLLSTGVAAAGEKLWNVPGAREFAQRKLEAVLKQAGDGVCYEYLSPTYTAVDFTGAYAARQFAFSDDFAAKADAMVNHLWTEVAQAYHAPTYQILGPNNRSYGDNMLEYAAGLKYWIYLAVDGNYPLPDAQPEHGWDQAATLLIAPLQVGPRPEFQQPIPQWREFTAVGPDDGLHPTRHLFQYRQGNLGLSTVAFQDEWKQKRNLVAYWRNPGPAPLNMSVGFCIDQSNETLPNGFPYAQIHFYSKQVNDAALVALVASSAVPKHGSSCALVFNKEAALSAADSVPLVVKDGSITTYLYPVATAPATYQPLSDAHTFRLTRDWDSSDAVADLHVLSYLLVLRPSDAPAPVVTELSLAPTNDTVSAHAKVDGAELAVSFKN